MSVFAERIKRVFSKDGICWFSWYLLKGTGLDRLLSDRVYINLQYRCATGKKLNLENPRSFNEKLQWLKLYDHNPEYTKMVDKVEAKRYVTNIIGEEYIIPTIAVYDKIEDIEWEKLPNQFVMKCSHDSGGIIVCKDKTHLDIPAAIKTLKKSCKSNFYYFSREWPYKNVKPRILVEEYLTDNTDGSKSLEDEELTDYKFFCFDGAPKALFIASDRLDKTIPTKFDFFDMDFNHLPFRGGHPNADRPIKCPSSFEEMKTIATKLSAGFPHIRVDLYEVDGHIYFGELTFCHWGGMAPFDPEEWNYKFGEWIKLPKC